MMAMKRKNVQTINGERYEVVGSTRNGWLLIRLSDGASCRAFGQEIRPKMAITAE